MSHRLGFDVKYEAISPRNLRQLSHKGEEDKFMASVFEEIREGDTVLDIGGHVGMWTILFAKQVGPKGFVYVFEPEQQGCDAIKRNVEINDLKNVETIMAAVSDENTTAKFYTRPGKATHSIFEQTPAPSPTGNQDENIVEVVTIDELVEQGRIKIPNFIKLDIEGAELLALEGMKNTLKNVRAILVEHHDALRLQGFDDPESAVKEKLLGLGVGDVKAVDPDHLLGRNV